MKERQASSEHTQEAYQPAGEPTHSAAQGTAIQAQSELAIQQQKQLSILQEKAPPVQRKENPNGLPAGLQSGVEALSGLDMSDVKVHQNSSKPAEVNAHAFAQGTEIHLAPGQEKHLPHEAWHVAQQKQGRVQPTTQLQGGVQVNDDPGLEREADQMGAKAMQMKEDAMKTEPKGVGNSFEKKK